MEWLLYVLKKQTTTNKNKTNKQTNKSDEVRSEWACDNVTRDELLLTCVTSEPSSRVQSGLSEVRAHL